MSHEHWLETAAAYALDSVEPDERVAFESHLTSCAECRMAVHEFREVTGLLVHAVPAVAAPPDLGRRVAELVRRDVDGPGHRRRPTLPSVLPWLAAAASITVAVLAGTAAMRSAAVNTSLEQRMGTLEAGLQERDSVLGYLTGPEVHVVSLARPGEKPVARVFWNHTEDRFIVTAFELPPAAPGRTYQLWAVSEGQPPVSMGTFNTRDDGTGTAVLVVTQEVVDLGFIHVCALTEEPAGGSRAPTETPRLAGEWRHTD